MPATATRGQGKSAFVREVLMKDPRANSAAVNEAWRAPGMPGEISAGLVNHLRFRVGLSGNLMGTKATGTRPGRRKGRILAGANGSTRAPSRRPYSELAEMEVEIDRLLMKVVAFGRLADVEDALRQTRRQLYAGMLSES